ncbi:mannan endo-1,6-alpha-mannosidase [Tothia fuscella]|uniref:Mannan endo-1,6-alpha-mannosidase n=1 Tax=Tothia fuscella TaxID=1048955 RepID=A0A9P4NFD7_9PEZI|nr:mannan endo-1,6-alpha-mannosidase [Tothia fuscella]
MKLPCSSTVIIGGLLAGAGSVQGAIQVSWDSTASIKQAASTLAHGMVKYYTGNVTGDVPGNLPAPYYWWEAGAMFSTLIDYWYYTGDTTYNSLVTQAMLWQTGPNADYMPPNQTKTLGNDDQAFWGMAAMSAAEARFPDPPADKPQWLALAQAVFNTQAPRWDTQTCGGGLKWQIFTFNNGYNYKNTISNGCFFNMAARLAKYTGNNTYSEWAEKSWDWTAAVGLMSPDYHFFDGSDDTLNCTQINHIQWTYNAGVYLYGAANMWNVTQDAGDATKAALWKARVTGMLTGLEVFFENKIMKEVACEDNGKCDVDQRSFKAYLSRWMAATTKVAPWTANTILPYLDTSSQAAVGTCKAGADGNQCGLRWSKGAVNDGSMGVGEQMAVLEVVQGRLIGQVQGPVTNSTGGTSKGDSAAGSNADDNPLQFDQITTGDKAGAGILTTLILVALFGGAWWMALK